MTRQNKSKMPFFMMTGLGTCQEYSNGTAAPAFCNDVSDNEDVTVDLWVEVFDDMINLGQVLAGEAVFFKAKQTLQKRGSSLKHLKLETEVLLSGIMAPHPIS